MVKNSGYDSQGCISFVIVFILSGEKLQEKIASFSSFLLEKGGSQ